jgi:OOP family OmpA-OmpF porin
MKLQLFSLLASGLLLAASPSGAADSGFFVGAGVGDMNTNVDDVFDTGYEFDEGDLGFKVFGGYRFFPWLAVEGAYIDGGSPEVKESDGFGTTAKLAIELKSIMAAAVFTLPLGERFEVFIKPGIAFWDANTRLSITTPDFSDSIDADDNGSAFFLGGGAGFNFTDNLGIRLEYEWFEAAPKYDSDTEEFVSEYDASAGFLSASFVYSF